MAGCSVREQPTSNETVAAFEVALPTAKDRAALLTILRTTATAAGGHLDAASDKELRSTAEASPLAKMSVHAAVWEGAKDEENWATIMDQSDHIGQVWIMFARGRNEAQARSFRQQGMRDIAARWPDVLSLPILDRRTIPLRRDLIRTAKGYRLNPTATARYKS
ncbi:hypothetical protein ASG11_02865 [Sphingomonas sp. Leaf357]|nr:hypothetical protein ASG11_02865 [Sphingomonas sp. Leaf357]